MQYLQKLIFVISILGLTSAAVKKRDLHKFSKTANSTTETFEMENCDQEIEIFRFEWLENSTNSLRKLRIRNCQLERVVVKNSSAIQEFPYMTEIDFGSNRIDHVQIDAFATLFRNLTILNFGNNAIGNFFDFGRLRLKILDLSKNRISEIPQLPLTLEKFNISHNPIRKIRRIDFVDTENLEILDLSHCKIDRIEENAFSMLQNLKILYLNGNRLSNVPTTNFRGLSRIQTIDLAWNRLEKFDPQILTGLISLEDLRLDGNPFRRLARLPSNLTRLTRLSITETRLITFDFDALSELKNLQTLILRDNREMRACVGVLATSTPSIRELDLSNCALTQLRSEFFENLTTVALRKIDIVGNPWACDCRLNQWYNRLITSQSINPTSICANHTGNTTDFCDIGAAITSGSIETTTYGSEAILDCGAYGDPSPSITWERAIKNIVIGRWPSTMNETNEDAKYEVLPGGLLLVRETTGKEIGPYRCVIENRYGNATALIFLRLDYSNWWEMKLYSIICGIITAIGFFILNVIYVAIRRLVIWRISKLEQTSRVRLLLEAMEKYRQRQMENLHEKYTAKMNQIRENYHGQVDQMRKSYVAQSERFRDYRAAQMESMSHHIDSIRDNYNWQANRVREYGSRHMERLWENYQRQVNRLRAFSLQQRLRLMRQYKIKQRYWNKMFESVNIETSGSQKNSHRRVVIDPEMIELPDLPPAAVVDDVEELATHPGPSSGGGNHVRSSLIDDFDDAVSALIMTRTLEEVDDADDDDYDGSSYHSIPGEDLEPLEAEILSQVDIDTEEAMREQIPPIIALRDVRI